jgi:hypothetical protein
VRCLFSSGDAVAFESSEMTYDPDNDFRDEDPFRFTCRNGDCGASDCANCSHDFRDNLPENKPEESEEE